MLVNEEDYLLHYGILRKSGRYPWGSGDTQGQRNQDFLGYVDSLKKKGLSESEIAKSAGLSTTELRALKSIAKNEQKQADINEAQRLRDKGMSVSEIGRQMGRNESSVRALLAPGAKDKNDVLVTTANVLKKNVAEKEFVDIGAGVENHLGIANTKLKTSVAMLQEEGYRVLWVRVPQVGTGNLVTHKVLCGPDADPKDVFNDHNKIRQITEYSDDGGRSYLGILPPKSISLDRVGVRYAEQGGATEDGVIWVRPGVKDLDLGGTRYAQVRVQVGDSHYLKGMALYKPDMPPGVDLVFNTNKSSTGNKLDAMKKLEKDPDNPFGSTIRRQITAKDKDGNDQVTSVMNLVNEEGSWDNWSRSLSTQVLSKQNHKLAAQQLDVTYQSRKSSLDEIMSLTNPTVRQKLLEEYADSTDSASVHLKAAALPRQSNHVILPINSLKENEVYAPTFRNGELVVLVRHPHGGIFEIPELRVNNKNKEAISLIGRAEDAIGIHSKVAQQLSGADFDGDAVLVIPNNNRQIKTAPALKELKNFDPKASFPAYDGMKPITPKNKQTQMGIISNLITDMTIKGATQEELSRAIRHSMVVIDSEKHNLDYRGSAKTFGIRQLHEKYQKGPRGGAETIISRAGSKIRVDEFKPRRASEGGPIDKTTGRKMFRAEPESYVNKEGQVVIKKRTSKRLAETEDARTLLSKNPDPIEIIYANHSNRLKALANQARKESVNTEHISANPSAKKVYHAEVESLNASLHRAQMNQPLERQAQLFANTVYSAKLQANPDLDPSDEKKIKSQALLEARTRLGVTKQDIQITPREWEAIQAGAIAPTKLKEILRHTDMNSVIPLAMPKTTTMMTSSKINLAKQKLAAGYTQAEVADSLGISVTTLKRSLSE